MIHGSKVFLQLSAAVDSALALLEKEPERLLVGYSGGLDSTVLLHCAARMYPQKTSAIHINHGLQASSAAWQEHCKELASQLAVPIVVEQVEVANFGGSVEDSARQARYSAFLKHMNSNDVLLLAHHQSDQAETVLQRSFRGTGMSGLAGMPAQRALGDASLLRPFLHIPRQQIHDYAIAHDLHWIEDPHNRSTVFARSFIREQILPLVKEHWPNAIENLSRSTAVIRQQSDVFNQYLDADLAEMITKDDHGEYLALQKLRPKTVGQQRALVARWLSARYISPEVRRLDHIFSQIIPSAEGAKARLEMGPFVLLKNGRFLYLTKNFGPVNFDYEVDLNIRNSGMIKLPHSCGCVTISADAKASGINAVVRNYAKTNIDKALVKDLLRKTKTPWWLRDRIPLIYMEGELVQIGNTLTLIKQLNRGVTFTWTQRN